MTPNRFRNYFYSPNKGRRQVHKFDHYLDLYDKYFSRYYDTYVRVLEIGVKDGGSLQMWKRCFGKNARVYGADKSDTRLKESEQIKTFTVDQSNKKDLLKLASDVGQVDIIIDDGSHVWADQILTFETLFLFSLLAKGIYFVEDVQTSYIEDSEYGKDKKDSFVEYAKKLIDDVNQPENKGYFSPYIKSVNFHPFCIVIEKGEQGLFSPRMTGEGTSREDY